MERTQDVHIVEFSQLTSPNKMKKELPLLEQASQVVVEARNTIKHMLRGKDNRLLAIVGPCSIHDPATAMDYAQRLAKLSEEIKDTIFVVMRVYFEKPRTTIGWKGLINDPDMDGSEKIDQGIQTARKLLLDINGLGLPAATEFLDPIVPQYIADLIAWAAIGARTTESQTHREMTSGLSMPVGLKNSTGGNLQIAVDAMKSAGHPHRFLGINQDGQTALVKTSGNVWCHIILRGGRSGPNYEADSVRTSKELMTKSKLLPYVMVDCSHANSNKDFYKQEQVLQSVVEQRLANKDSIFGVMLESNINEGKQSIPADLSQLQYGVSVTDGCMSWETTERILREAAEKLRAQTAVGV